jgi:hypothetical protein
MKRHSIIFLITILTILSCKTPKKNRNNSLELFKIGVPEKVDFSNFKKIGADHYFHFDQFNDTVLIKYYKVLDDKTGEVAYPIKTQYFYKKLSSIDEKNLNYTFNFLLNLKTQSIPTSNLVNCDTFGLWIGVLTDSINKKHYYIFSCENLPTQLLNLCESMLIKTYESKGNQNYPGIGIVNTDSLTTYYIENHLKNDIKQFLPKPIVQSLKYLPSK